MLKATVIWHPARQLALGDLVTQLPQVRGAASDVASPYQDDVCDFLFYTLLRLWFHYGGGPGVAADSKISMQGIQQGTEELVGRLAVVHTVR